MSKTKEYIKEVIAEGKNVHWPTRKQAILYTVAVLVVSAIVAYYLGLLDFLFGEGLGLLLIK
jgi:preprotein translocase SecE subunit